MYGSERDLCVTVFLFSLNSPKRMSCGRVHVGLVRTLRDGVKKRGKYTVMTPVMSSRVQRVIDGPYFIFHKNHFVFAMESKNSHSKTGVTEIFKKKMLNALPPYP